MLKQNILADSARLKEPQIFCGQLRAALHVFMRASELQRSSKRLFISFIPCNPGADRYDIVLET